MELTLGEERQRVSYVIQELPPLPWVQCYPWIWQLPWVHAFSRDGDTLPE